MMVVVQDVAWSRDGRKLFFSAMRVRGDYSDYTPGKWAVYGYDVRGGKLSRISSNTFSVGASPTTALIVVGKLVAGNRDLYTLDENGREVARLTDDPAEDFGGAWSPDGRRIAFTSKRNGRSEAFVADADGTNPRRLIDAGTDRTLNPAWSPDGRIVYGQGQKGGVINTYTVAPDGSDMRPLFAIKSQFTRYSPDGARIAYLEFLPQSGVGVVIADRDGRIVATVPLDGVGEPP
jgi:TolB protein